MGLKQEETQAEDIIRTQEKEDRLNEVSNGSLFADEGHMPRPSIKRLLKQIYIFLISVGLFILKRKWLLYLILAYIVYLILRWSYNKIFRRY